MKGSTMANPEWRVTFMDKHSSETRSIVVNAIDVDDAENKGIDEAEKKGWPDCFRLLDAVEV
jgi:hypothetical protein